MVSDVPSWVQSPKRSTSLGQDRGDCFPMYLYSKGNFRLLMASSIPRQPVTKSLDVGATRRPFHLIDSNSFGNSLFPSYTTHTHTHTHTQVSTEQPCEDIHLQRRVLLVARSGSSFSISLIQFTHIHVSFLKLSGYKLVLTGIDPPKTVDLSPF